ncbi:uncharacterized protein LOC119834623 [Zerene cesonia]|uniref:uncharacterized protein LOC119834623 n=1 Tax=Zerene cesonia TaxID=33412 RepID=UPI0018E51671|nr:uncharacterized protein LOC119834623 [Zerene cesonia]
MDKLFKDKSFEEFTVTCDEIINNLFEHEVIVQPTNKILFNSVRKEIRDIVCNTCCDLNKISKILYDNEYEEEKVDYFLSAIQKRKNELLYLILLHHNSKQGETVALFDCALKLVCGTSELKTLKYPILQLALTTYNNTEHKQRLYDVDKNMLRKLIDVLESSDLN